MVLTLLKYENYTAHQSRVYLALAKRTSLQCSLQLVFVLQNGNGDFRYLITKSFLFSLAEGVVGIIYDMQVKLSGLPKSYCTPLWGCV